MGKRVRRAEVIKEDRISKLPQELKHRILYFLPTKVAAATALLSRLWRDAWPTLPWLRLGEEFFSGILPNHPELSHSHEQIINFIDRMFQRRFNCHKTMLEELQLHIPRLNLVSGDKIPESTVCLLDKFLVWVVREFQVKKVDYSIGYCDDYYVCKPRKFHDGGLANNFMSSTLSSWKQGGAEISDLTLRGCILNSCFETKWSTLRILSLKHVKLFDQQVLDSVTAHCCLLESLSMIRCSGGDFDTLNASCLKRLVTLEIWDPCNYFKKILIDAPNLENICTYHGEDTVSRSEGSCVIHNLAVSKGLTCIKILNNARITDKWLNHISIANLSKLKLLSLNGCHNVKRARISSRSLSSIYLSIIGLEELKLVDVPRLLYLHFGYVHQSPPTTPSFVLNGASASMKAGFYLQGYNDTQIKDTNYALECEKLVKFLGVFNVLRRLKVIFYGIVVVPSEVRNMLSPPLAAKGQEIKYVVRSWKKHQNFKEVISGLLWLSPCGPKKITFNLRPYVSKTFEFEYKEDDGTLKSRCSYCGSLPVRCWRHCLHEVTIRNEGLEKSQVSVKQDADMEEFFKTATTEGPRNIDVKVIYCEFPLKRLFKIVSKNRN